MIRSLNQEQIPLLYVAPRPAPQNQPRPGVLVAHGFAGSKQLMLGYGHTLARAGYAVMLWDFEGHGANSVPLQRYGPVRPGQDYLERNLNVALQALSQQPGVDPSRLALLGHSMGSEVVIAAGIQEPERFAATIAISPVGSGVTPQSPRNLQLQLGSWEGGCAAIPSGYLQPQEAQTRILQQAGRENSSSCLM